MELEGIEIVDSPQKKQKKKKRPGRIKRLWLRDFIIKEDVPQIMKNNSKYKWIWGKSISKQIFTDKYTSFSRGNRTGAYFAIGICLFILSFFIVAFYKGERGDFRVTSKDLILVFSFGGALSAIILFCIVYLIRVKAKYIYICRLEGAILAPAGKNKYRRIIFKDAEVGKTSLSSGSGTTDTFITVDGVRLDDPGINADKVWAWHVWYMDKNRPLPPGSVYDAFREKDFERRKAEGFPAPLYKSKIPTPEATPEQQKEREKYWKDEDYMVK